MELTDRLVELKRWWRQNVYRVVESERVIFGTRRKREGEVVNESRYQGVIDDKYVWGIEPMTVLNFLKFRRSLIETEINDVHIPDLERDDKQRFESVAGIYRREKVYRRGKLKYDRVTIKSSPQYRKQNGNK